MKLKENNNAVHCYNTICTPCQYYGETATSHGDNYDTILLACNCYSLEGQAHAAVLGPEY